MLLPGAMTNMPMAIMESRSVPEKWRLIFEAVLYDIRLSLTNPVSHDSGSTTGFGFGNSIIVEILKERDILPSFEFIKTTMYYLC